MLCFTVAQHTMFMDSPIYSKHEFVNNVGLNHTNSLEHLLSYEYMEEEITNLKLSSYIDIVSLREALGSAKSALSILSFNAQSINAKFDEFRIAIDQINEKHPISIICVQESWLHSNSNLDIFELRDYTMISKGKHCSEHGGWWYMCMTILTMSCSVCMKTVLDGKIYLLWLTTKKKL